MLDTIHRSFLRTFLCRISIFLCLFFTALFMYSSAQAKICVLPGGHCPNEDPSGGGTENESCDGYNLAREKCVEADGTVLPCREGWDCSSCTNASGVHWKCDAINTDIPAGYEAGLTGCNDCEAYDYIGFTGNKIIGRCTDLKNTYSDITTTQPEPCFTYIKPSYVKGVTVGATIEPDNQTNCYAVITKMMDETIEPPQRMTTDTQPHCTTYLSQRDGEGLESNNMCYTHGISIGANFDVDDISTEIFTVEDGAGTDETMCHRANGCAGSNSWYQYKDEETPGVDGEVFTYIHDTASGITCRKATGCNNDNDWYNYEELGQYQNVNFTMDVKSSGTSGGTVTCYRVTGCYGNAYTSKPDTKYFTVAKVDDKYSRGYECWAVTGKAAHAYDENEIEPNYFEYTNSDDEEGNKIHQYISRKDEQGREVGEWVDVTYYNVKDCYQSAYSAKPDDKYFKSDSRTQDLIVDDDNVTDKTCWIATDKADNAYTADDRILNYFAYSNSNVGGSESGEQINQYDSSTNSFNKVTYYRVTGCSDYAYTGQPESDWFASSPQTQVDINDNDKTCWNTTGCSDFSYDATCNSDETCTNIRYLDTRYFAEDDNANHLNGTSTDITCYHATGRASHAYSQAQDATYFVSVPKTAYIDGDGEDTATYWTVTSCNNYSYTSEEQLPAQYFVPDSDYRWYKGGNSNITCWHATGCASGASTTSQAQYKTAGGANIFVVDSDTKYLNGENTNLQCFRATGCNSSAGSQPGDPGSCRTFSTNTQSGTLCYYDISVTGASDCTTSDPGNCKLYSTGRDSHNNPVYYSISNIANGATTSKPTGCQTWSSGNGTNGTTCYWNISAVWANDCTTSKPAACKNYSYGTNTAGTGFYYNITNSCTGCTTSKPSTTYDSCYTFTQSSDSSGNTIYCNPSLLSKEATSQSQTCTLTQSCTDSSACTATSESWSDTSPCTATSQSCSTGCSQSQSCSAVCTVTTNTTLYDCSQSQSCGCKGTQSRSGSRSLTYYQNGTKYGTQSRTGTNYGTQYRSASRTCSHTRTGSRTGSQSRQGSQSRSRSVTCNANGTGYSIGSWGGWGACTSSASWGACGNYGSCSYTSWSSPSCTGCSYGGWGGCNYNGCSWNGWSACGNYGGCGSLGGAYGHSYGSCSWGGWSSCNNQSDYVTASGSTTSGCSCGYSRSYTTRCLSGTSYGSCSGSDYIVTSQSASYNCGGTQVRYQYCMGGWTSWTVTNSGVTCSSSNLQKCVNGTCQFATSGCDNCSSGQYCHVTGSSKSGSCAGNGSYFTAHTGVCASRPSLSSMSVSGLGTVYFTNAKAPADGKNWDYFSAYNLCRSYGRRLVTRSECSSYGSGLQKLATSYAISTVFLEDYYDANSLRACYGYYYHAYQNKLYGGIRNSKESTFYAVCR